MYVQIRKYVESGLTTLQHSYYTKYMWIYFSKERIQQRIKKTVKTHQTTHQTTILVILDMLNIIVDGANNSNRIYQLLTTCQMLH